MSGLKSMDMDLTTLVRNGTPQSLRELPLPLGLKALVLAPHPDDFDEIGVTLRHLHRNGHSLDVGVVSTGSGVEDAYRPGLTLADKTELRKQEQQRSLRFFGLPEKCLTFLSLANDSEDQPIDTPGNRSAVEAFVAAKAPDIVFLPHGNDTNSGHRVMYSLLKQVGQRLGPSFVMFLNRDPKTIEMRTDLYMPFDQDEAKWKAQLLRFHDSQHQRNLRTRGHGFDDRILNVNRAIARELLLKWEYAEAFEIERPDTPEKRISTTGSNKTSG
jgi:LmbE family N-acetylglucosaminyl deacetylase